MRGAHQNGFLLVVFIKSVKHFDFLDVPDAKVAVPPQKPAEGRVTNHKPVL